MLEEGVSFEQIAEKYGLAKTFLRRYYDRWAVEASDSRPLSAKDIYIDLSDRGRTQTLSTDEEDLISKAIEYYAENLTLLSRGAVVELAQTIIDTQRACEDKRPTKTLEWLEGYMKRNEHLKFIAL